MRFYTSFSAKFFLLLALAFNFSYGFEYILEKTYLNSPLLIQKEIAKKVEKDNEQLLIDIYKMKSNLTLNTIKYSLNVLRTQEITLKLIESNENLLTRLEQKTKTQTKEQTEEIKKHLLKLSNEINLQKEMEQKALQSYKDYTQFAYSSSNLLEKLSLIEFPKRQEDIVSAFHKQTMTEQKAILETFVLKKIDEQASNYFQEYLSLTNLQKELKQKQKTLLNSYKKASDINSLFSLQEQLFEIEKKLLENKYALLFQKAKLSFVSGNLLTDMKKVPKPAMATPNIPKIITAIQEPKPVYTFSKLKKIHFVGNMSDVSSYSIHIVKRNAELLKQMKEYKLELQGHSDNLGDKQSNYELALRRAIKTKEALVKFGVDANKISVVSFGDTKPIAENKTKKGRLLNRRVEFKLIEEK